MIQTLLVVALLGPTVEQQRTPVPFPVAIEDARADAREARLHRLPPMRTAAQRARLEAVLTDTRASKSDRDAAHAEYLELLGFGTTLERAEQMVETLEFVLESEFPGAALDLRPSADGSALLALATVAQHAAIEEVLRDLQDETRLVDVQASVMSLSNLQLEQLLEGRAARTMPLESRERTIVALKDVDVLQAPRVLLHVGSVGTVSTGEEVPYISNYVLTVVPESETEIADPTVATVFDGLSLEVRAAPRKGRLRVKVDFVSTTVERPIATEMLQIGGLGAEVTVQRPKVKTIQASAVFDLAEGAAILLGARDEEDHNSALVVLTAKLVEAEVK